MAKIEVGAKDTPVPGTQHLYFKYTFDNGEERIIRGGVGVKGDAGFVFFDNIKVVDSTARTSLDYDSKKEHDTKLIFSGTDAQVQAKIYLMKAEASRINTEQYDYEFPMIKTLVPTWGKTNNQNSNTVVKSLAKVANLDNQLVTFINDKNLNVPGYDATFENNAYDKKMDAIYDGLTDARM